VSVIGLLAVDAAHKTKELNYYLFMSLTTAIKAN
jgi:hypothetical protein